MQKENFDFQKELKASIFGADEKQERHELVAMIFKSYVAKCIEYTLRKKISRIESAAIYQIRRNLINEFRNAELGEYQKSVKQYEELFNTAIEEIFNEAGHAHEGINIATVDQTLEINKRAYAENRGIIIPN